MENTHLPDDMAKLVKEQQSELNLQLKVYYEDGRSGLIPGRFRNPDGVYYGLDLFMDLDVYEMMCDVVVRLKLAAKDQLKVVLAALNHLDAAARSECAAVRAEVIDRRDGRVIASSDNS